MGKWCLSVWHDNKNCQVTMNVGLEKVMVVKESQDGGKKAVWQMLLMEAKQFGSWRTSKWLSNKEKQEWQVTKQTNKDMKLKFGC